MFNILPTAAPAPQRKILLLTTALWLLLMGGGFAALIVYHTTPGAQHAAAGAWPSDVKLARSDQHPTLLMFVHPQCPCTTASLRELATVLAKHKDVRAYAVLLEPDSPGLPGGDWSDARVAQHAREIQRLEVVWDAGGELSSRFGAATSGDVMLYDAAGRLQFRGGITSARGHEGESAGRCAILDLLSGRQAVYPQTAVYGCPLEGPDADRSACSPGEAGL